MVLRKAVLKAESLVDGWFGGLSGRMLICKVKFFFGTI